MLPEHGQLMKYDVQDTSTSSYTHGSATGMVRWQPLCRICTRLHATRAERAAEATSARVASTGTAESGSSTAAASLSAIIAAPSVAAGAAGKATSNSYNVRNTKLNVLNSDPAATSRACFRVGRTRNVHFFHAARSAAPCPNRVLPHYGRTGDPSRHCAA